jgi:hypothetical protein
MKKLTAPIFLTFTCALITSLYSLPGQAAIKCWKNNEGVRECGNNVPPEFAQQGHQELSKSGTIVGEQKRAKTADEMKQEAKQKELLAEEQRLEKERILADRVLLDTYSSVNEIEAARDERLMVIQSSITLANKQTETIQTDLDKRIMAAAEAERSGKSPNEALLKDIATLERQIKTKKLYVSEREIELELDQTKNEYAAKIDRFKVLKRL